MLQAYSSNPQAALAAELATRLLPLPEVLKRYSISTQGLKNLLRDPQFKHMVTEYRREWASPLTAKERVRLKSALAVEDGLVELYHIFQNSNIAPQPRIDAFKQLVGLADMSPRKEGEAQGPSFSLTLNLGGDKSVTIDAQRQPLLDADDDDDDDGR